MSWMSRQWWAKVRKSGLSKKDINSIVDRANRGYTALVRTKKDFSDNLTNEKEFFQRELQIKFKTLLEEKRKRERAGKT